MHILRFQLIFYTVIVWGFVINILVWNTPIVKNINIVDVQKDMRVCFPSLYPACLLVSISLTDYFVLTVIAKP